MEENNDLMVDAGWIGQNSLIPEMLEEQIRATLKELEETEAKKENASRNAMLLSRLKLLQEQQLAIQKLEVERNNKAQGLLLDQQKFEVETAMKNRELELNQQKLEVETAIKNRELELKREADQKAQALEEAKLKEQKKSNLLSAATNGVIALTGLGGLWLTLKCFKMGLTFEQTGSYTTKTSQQIGSLFSILRRSR